MGVAGSKRSRNGSEYDSSSDVIANANNIGIPESWVTVRSRTTNKEFRGSVKGGWTFPATKSGVVIGRGTSVNQSREHECVLSDPSLLPEHARIMMLDDGSVAVIVAPEARSYLSIGQIGQAGLGPQLLTNDMSIKMGACSLQITDICVDRRDVPSFTHEPGPGALSDSTCYICFDDESTPDNPLMPSPCTCSKLIHKECLFRWIQTKGSRSCSICKAKLPIEATVEPPFLVLRVVRHMRGLQWQGEREYVMSFRNRDGGAGVVVGSGSDCDLMLPDPSLSRRHAKVTFRDRKFYVEDLESSAGTFIRLEAGNPFVLPLDTPVNLKMGRSSVTVKLKRRRGSILPGWFRKSMSSLGVGTSGGGSTPGLFGGGVSTNGQTNSVGSGEGELEGFDPFVPLQPSVEQEQLMVLDTGDGTAEGLPITPLHPNHESNRVVNGNGEDHISLNAIDGPVSPPLSTNALSSSHGFSTSPFYQGSLQLFVSGSNAGQASSISNTHFQQPSLDMTHPARENRNPNSSSFSMWLEQADLTDPFRYGQRQQQTHTSEEEGGLRSNRSDSDLNHSGNSFDNSPGINLSRLRLSSDTPIHSNSQSPSRSHSRSNIHSGSPSPNVSPTAGRSKSQKESPPHVVSTGQNPPASGTSNNTRIDSQFPFLSPPRVVPADLLSQFGADGLTFEALNRAMGIGGFSDAPTAAPGAGGTQSNSAGVVRGSNENGRADSDDAADLARLYLEAVQVALSEGRSFAPGAPIPLPAESDEDSDEPMQDGPARFHHNSTQLSNSNFPSFSALYAAPITPGGPHRSAENVEANGIHVSGMRLNTSPTNYYSRNSSNFQSTHNSRHSDNNAGSNWNEASVSNTTGDARSNVLTPLRNGIVVNGNRVLLNYNTMNDIVVPSLSIRSTQNGSTDATQPSNPFDVSDTRNPSTSNPTNQSSNGPEGSSYGNTGPSIILNERGDTDPQRDLLLNGVVLRSTINEASSTSERN